MAMAVLYRRVFLSSLANLHSNILSHKTARLSSAQFSPSAAYSSSPSVSLPRSDGQNSFPWRSMCLYYTQGKCNLMNDPIHIAKFSHDCSSNLQVNAADIGCKSSQNVDFFLVIHLEWKVEILEFPVLLVDAKSMGVVDVFHRFVRPTKMLDEQVNKEIEGKYKVPGVARVWRQTALPFKEVIRQFDPWLSGHHLWEKEVGGCLTRAAFVTCANSGLETKILQQCVASELKLPSYFMEWIDIMDVYQKFYGVKATRKKSMFKQHGIPLLGCQHLGIDVVQNITKLLQLMLADGAVMEITKRNNVGSRNVEFLLENWKARC